MQNNYKILNWDSQFFGYKIAAIQANNLKLEDLKKIITKLKSQNVKLTYCFADPADELSNFSFKSVSGLLVDKKVTFFKEISETDNITGSQYIKSYNRDYVSDKLKSIALQSGKYSRFNVDPNFKNREFEKLYIEWISKSVQKEIANEVLVYYENGDEKGLITLGLKDNYGSIGLLAVDEKERGKSIGKKLVHSALKYFKKKKANTVEVVTQIENKGACGFYESLGFEVKSLVNIYHLWIN
jgi:dTDP-4-amino-4,6-dideoxy-D-galactose acyltransferase